MPVLGRVEEKRWATIEYSPHHSKLTCPPAVRKLCFPVDPPHPLPLVRALDCLPSQRAGLTICGKPTTSGAFPALACLPPGGATPLQSSTQHHQPPGKGLQPRKARISLAQPCNICLHPKAVLPIQLPRGRALWVLSSPTSLSRPWGVAALLWNSCPTLPAPCKSPTAQKHQDKLCLAE